MTVYQAIDHGVIADGTTDDTPAMNTLLDTTANGDTVVLPANKTVCLKALVYVRKQITITGGRISLQSSSPAFWVRTGGVRFTDIEFVGQGSATFDAAAVFIRANGTLEAPYKNLRFERLRMTGSPAVCLKIEYAEDVRIVDCTALDFAYAGLLLVSVRNVTVRDSLIGDCTHKQSNSYGITVTDTLNTEAARSRDVLIDGNTVRNMRDWAGIDSHGGYNIRVVNNQLFGCAAGIDLVQGDNTRLIPPQRGLIANNYVEWAGANAQRGGIRLFGKDSTVLASGVIANNTVVGYTQPVRAWSYDPTKTVLGQNVML